MKPAASLSLDLDNKWSYLKVHGDKEWEQYPTYLPLAVPVILDFLARRNQKITFFVVGKDATLDVNHGPLRQIVAADHELANHSFHHEPWMQNKTEEEIIAELKTAEDAIEKATGHRPHGFRGPGFCNSPALLGALRKIDYQYDASILPSILGPVARLYYFANSKMNSEQRETRSDLFGHFSDGFRPLKAFQWQTTHGPLLEIPVTTMPVFRTPFHLSYLIWLSRYSKFLAINYLRLALILCRLRGVGPSFLLHPLDFLGKDDAPELSFFPGMELSRERKLEVADKFLELYQKYFDVVTMSEHVRRIRAAGPLKTVSLELSEIHS